MKIRSLVALAICTPLMVALLSSSAAAAPSASPDEGTEALDVPVVAVVDTALSFTGDVRKAGGAIVPGAEIQLLAWPAGLDKLEDGEAFSLAQVGTATADKSGRFEVSADRSAIVELAARSQKVMDKQAELPLDLEILAVSAEGVASYITTVFVQPSSGKTRTEVAVDQTGARTSRANVRSGKVDLDLRMLDQSVNVDYGGVPLDMQPLSLHNCKQVKNYGAQKTVIGTLGGKVGGYKAHMEFSAGGTSTVSTGMSLTGKFGSFESNGSTTVASSGDPKFPTKSSKGYWYMETKFIYGQFACQWGTTASTRYVVRTTGYAGGTSERTATTPGASYCVTYQAGSGWTQKKSTASTFSNAATGMYSVVGFKHSSRSGYSTSVAIDFDFPTKKGLCGKNGFPGDSPGQVVVVAA